MEKMLDLAQRKNKLTEETRVLREFMEAAHGHNKMVLQVDTDVSLFFEEKDSPARERILDIMCLELNRLEVELKAVDEKVAAVEALL